MPVIGPGTGASLWAPNNNDLGASLLAEYDASNPRNLVTSSGSVDVWRDSGPRGLDLSQTGGNRPTYGATRQNGLPVVSFSSASSQSMSRAAGSFSVPTTTMFIVYQKNTGGSGYDGQLIDGIASTARHSAFIYGASNTIGVYQGSAIVNVGTNTTSQPAVLSFLCPANDASVSGSLDGVEASGGSAGTHALTGIRLGAHQSGTIQFFDGWIAHVVIYAGIMPRHNRRSVELALATKWGIGRKAGAASSPPLVFQ